MLDQEFDLDVERLGKERGDNTSFFAFADTVAARSYRGGNETHGWMGIKFQSRVNDEPSQIVMHVRMLDAEASLQQEALGIVGVNLCYGAFFLSHVPEELVESLLDKLTTGRIEIDTFELSGIEFRNVDNRIMALKLVQLGLSGAAMFGANREVLQPAEVLHNKAVLVERGSFRPPTHVNMDMLKGALAKFKDDPAVADKPILPLMELTMRNSARGRHGRGPPRFSRARRSARDLWHDCAHFRLLRILPARRLSRLADEGTHRRCHGLAERFRVI